MEECCRCGKCCQYVLDSKIKTCRYLIGEIGTFTTCLIYEHRYGTVIDNKIIVKIYKNRIKGSITKVTCLTRKNQNRYIEGCTYQ